MKLNEQETGNEPINMDRSELLKLLNNNVISQVISESKQFLFAGNRDGDIFVLNIADLETTEKPSLLRVFHQGKDVEINSLCFYRKFLVVGAIGIIYGLEWNEDRQKLSKKHCWDIKIPLKIDAIEVPDVNFMWLCKEREMLFAGCGDNNVYQIDLEDGRIIRTYTGHTDYIHGVVGDGNGRIFTASEDGTVRVWNERDRQCNIATFNLSKNTEIIRTELGGFIGAVAVKDDWLLAGGGPKLSLWHLSSMRCAEKFDFPGRVHVCDFVENEIVVAGEHKSAQIYSLNGELLADVPVDHTAVYSIAWQLEPIKFMSIAGYDNKLHILKQFRFLDTKIQLYGNTIDGELLDEEIDDDKMEEEKIIDYKEERTARYQ